MHEPPPEAGFSADGTPDELAAGAGNLFPVVYEELRRLAASCFDGQPANHTLQPTALVHEVFMRLADQTAGYWQDRTHFFAVAAIAMRQILVSHARKRSSLKRGGGRRRIPLTDAPEPAVMTDAEIVALDEALNELESLDGRKARVVVSRFFGGLTHEEIAHVLGISRSTVEADWRFSRAWLADWLQEDDAASSEDRDA